MGRFYNEILTKCPHKPQRQLAGTTISHHDTCVASAFVWDEEERSIGVSDGYKNERTPQ